MALNALDPFNVKQQLDRFNAFRDIASDVEFLRSLRRAALPLPIVDRQKKISTKVFPPMRRRPIPFFRDKRVGLVLSGGSGACVATIGVVRALEEAGVEPAAVSVCSGSALWGSMLSAGMSSQEMVDFTLSWRPEDYLDIQWAKLPRFAFQAMRGFSGIAKTEAVEQLYDRRLWHMSVGETQIPLYSIVFNMDLGRVEYFGSKLTPGLTIGELVRTAVALPILVESVRVDRHLYVDGGVVDVFPAEPLERYEKLDLYIGMNVILPPAFEADNISGWTQRRMGFLEATRQLRYATHLELARRTKARLGDRLILLDPVSHRRIQGARFYDMFLDRRKWPQLMRESYAHTKEALDAYRPRKATKRKAMSAH